MLYCAVEVTDWTGGKTASQAHRAATERCLLYTDTKAEVRDSLENLTSNSASCSAEFFFIASTLLFRLASVCLLAW